MKRGPLKVFYSYAHEDEALRDRIEEYLELLRRQNLVVGWHDRHIVPGTEWNEVIGESLASADIVLLLISRAFMESAYVNEVEIPEAMNAHESGGVRVVPILLEKVAGWESAPFAKLQILASEAKPISTWDDPVEAFRDIARGVRRVARDIIIEGGGPFEFGAHEFTEAELALLPKVDRERTATGLDRLRDDLNRTMPPRRYESNLLVATWALNKFGRRSDRLPGHQHEALFYMAQVISSFDLVALQEISRNLRRLEALVEVLGPDWSLLVTDVAPGVTGNDERFAFLYYQPRVEFRNFSSQVVVPPERLAGGKSTPVRQFARPPLVAAFRSGAMEFQVCTAHIVYGGGRRSATVELDEIRKLGDYLRARSRYEETDLLLLGDFQMGKRESPILDALRESEVQIPDELLHPTNLRKTHYFDLIGFASPKRSMPLGPSRPRSGTYDLFEQVLRDEDFDVYRETESFRNFADSPAGGSGSKPDNELRRYWMWKNLLVSDHLPLWAELSVDEPSDD